MASISEIRSKLSAARKAAQDGHDTLTQPELRKLSDVVEALQKELSDTICQGAKECPKCGKPPMGMIQPDGKGGEVFLVGCMHCPSVHEHVDGTLRHPHVRGGLIPRHAVEAWNEGMDYWAKVSSPEKIAAHEKKKAIDAATKAHDEAVAKAATPHDGSAA